MTQLSKQYLLSNTSTTLKSPDYSPPEIGIVHIGPGAFFRGHQAWYTHQAMSLSGGDWGISCVSMNSTQVADALNPQDGLYTLAVINEQTDYEVISSVQEVLVLKAQYEKIIDRLVSPNTKFVTLTITEKGYCLDVNGELDMAHQGINEDIIGNGIPKTAIGLLIRALNKRKATGIAAFSVISCDNITNNGQKLRSALISFADKVDDELSTWLKDQLITPCTMVDSITPATEEDLKQQVTNDLGYTDEWPIKREPFVQWVIEDILPSDKPDWLKAGAIYTQDVELFENAKLRLLNCPHSSLAYLGQLADIETVFDSMQEPVLVSFITKMIKEEIIPSLIAPEGFDLEQYSQDILERFRNPAICHNLSQIAWDGSQKLPMRVLPIIQHNLQNKLPIKALTFVIAAWFCFIQKRVAQTDIELVDPLAEKLQLVVATLNGDVKHDVQRFLTLSDVFDSQLIENSIFVSSLTHAYQIISSIYDDYVLDLSKLQTFLKV